jgi:DNA replication and repair protein RecF
MLTDIRLQNFRSYVDDSFEFGESVNIIVGPNASGKTNLLEAVLMVARGSSFRAKDAETMRIGKSWTRLDAHTLAGQRVVKLENGDAVRKSFEIDEQPLQRLNLQKTLPTVLFEPNHLLLLVGTPDARRNFLDDVLEQTVSGYATTRRAYRRTLAQRNALLKSPHVPAHDQIFVWNLRLSELGGKMAAERMKIVEQVNKSSTEVYRSLSNSAAKVSVEYRSACSIEQYETSLLKRLEASIEKDRMLGFTGAGPHRDDIRIILNGHAAEETASRGETRSLILMLKIIELQLLEMARGETPLLLLDDVFSELDGKRRHALTAYLEKYQTFITTTDADIVVKNFAVAANVIPLT